MLDDLRHRAADLLGAASQATLLTWGPAELQAAVVPCEARGLRLYALVPRTSDLLFNLEQRSQILAISPVWQLQGTARVLAPLDYPPDLRLLAAPEHAWSALVVVTPTRLHRLGTDTAMTAETIDLRPNDDERVADSG
ncbi:MAG: hypothetical protein HGA45_26735 [Chloroflexales bacterium]|nr:hypothetical protein [Chloroflexales bacterium]